MAKHKTLAFFIPHLGCPHQCSFCDQRTISGTQTAPKPAEIARTCQEMLSRYGTLESAEIAFFGGSFTAIDVQYQNALLQAVQPFLGKGKFDGIRISTRPDAVDAEILSRLKAFHVTAIELGAQSMSERVLRLNERGHAPEAVQKAAKQIREAGFSLGLQQMVGLYGSTLAEEYDTLEQLLACQPDTMRFYPTVILAGTKLAEYYASGKYTLLPEEAVLDFCADAICRCNRQRVRVIRLGLHDTPSVREQMVGGFFHPAYRELVESRLYRRALEQAAEDCGKPELFVETAPCTMSKLLGQHGSNRKHLMEQGISLTVRETTAVTSGTIAANGQIYEVYQERDVRL